MKRTIAAVTATLLLVGVSQTASTASELPRPLPAQVVEFVDHELVSQLQILDFRGEDGTPMADAPDFSAIALGSIIAVNLFSEEFQNNVQGGQVLTPLDEWLIPITRADKSIGTARIWIDGGQVELAGADGDVDVASILSTFPEDQNLVSYPQANEYYAFDGNSIIPLNTQAEQFLSGPLGPSGFQKILVERVAEAEPEAGPGDDIVGGLGTSVGLPEQPTNWWGIISLTTGAGAILITVVAFLRYRNSKPQVTSQPAG